MDCTGHGFSHFGKAVMNWLVSDIWQTFIPSLSLFPSFPLWAPYVFFFQLCHLCFLSFPIQERLFPSTVLNPHIKHTLGKRERAKFKVQDFLCHVQQKNHTRPKTQGISVLQTWKVSRRIKVKSCVEKGKRREEGGSGKSSGSSQALKLQLFLAF